MGRAYLLLPLRQRPDRQTVGSALRKEVRHDATSELSRDDPCGTRTGRSVAGLHGRQTGSGLRSNRSEEWLHLCPSQPCTGCQTQKHE